MNRNSDTTIASQFWKCDGCDNLDTQSHFMWCPGFALVREELYIDNDKDVIYNFSDGTLAEMYLPGLGIVDFCTPIKYQYQF